MKVHYVKDCRHCFYHVAPHRLQRDEDRYYGYCDDAFRLIERKEAPQPAWCPLPNVPDGIFHVVQKTAILACKAGLTD